MIKAIFSKLCPNCGGDISVERLEKGLPCERCMPKEGDPCKDLKEGRVLMGHSFGLLAPTGVGKTSFGLSMVSFLAKKNKRSYVILPTKLLVEQTVRKLKALDWTKGTSSILETIQRRKKGKRRKG
jgi:reverse gyrase